METQVTLGEMFAADARQLVQRRLPAMAWLALLRPIMDRVTSPHNPTPTRFRRRDALPRSTPGVPTFASGLDETGDLPDEGSALPIAVRERLRPVVGDGIEHVRVHADRVADAIARRHSADAVTVDRDIFFRSGMLLPDEPQGFALLAHEATHVLEAMRPGAAWRRATDAGVREEEALALQRERVTRSAPFPPLVTARPQVERQPSLPAAIAATPVSRPMKADSDRELAPSASERTDLDIEAMRKGLLRDLRSQLRVEFERGA
jgi:hypothetical protein